MDRFLFRLLALLGFGFVVAFLVVAGSGFLLAAVYLVLADNVGTNLAAVITGVSCFGAAGIIALIAWSVQRRPAPTRPAQRGKRSVQSPDTAQMAMAVGEMLGGDLNALAKNHRKGLIGASLVAGFAFGASPKLRRSLLDLIEN